MVVGTASPVHDCMLYSGIGMNRWLEGCAESGFHSSSAS